MQTSYIATESGAEVNVGVSISGRTERAVSIPLSIQDGTATSKLCNLIQLAGVTRGATLLTYLISSRFLTQQ